MESSSKPDRVIDCGGTLLVLERHGDYLEVRQPDENVMVRFRNFDGIAIVDGAKEIERREAARIWSERAKETDSVF